MSDPDSRIPLHLTKNQACYWVNVKVAQLLEKAESAVCNCRGFICNYHIHALAEEHDTNQSQDTWTMINMRVHTHTTKKHFSWLESGSVAYCLLGRSSPVLHSAFVGLVEMVNVQFMSVEIKEFEIDLMDVTCSGDIFTVRLSVMRYVMNPHECWWPLPCDCCINSLFMFARQTFRPKKPISPCGHIVPVQISDVLERLRSFATKHDAHLSCVRIFSEISKKELFSWRPPRSDVDVSRMLSSCCGFWFEQILIQLETALLDDKPHWYPLQTHDVSSIPLPQPSPYLPRRHTHMDAPGKKLQRKSSI